MIIIEYELIKNLVVSEKIQFRSMEFLPFNYIIEYPRSGILEMKSIDLGSKRLLSIR